MRGKHAREVYALLKCSSEEYKEALEVARQRAAGDTLGATGTEKINLAAHALQHLLPNPPEYHYSHFLGHRPNMIPGTVGRKSGNNPFYEWIAIAVSPVLYGVIHFLAWNDHFPTPLERVLWRVSSVVVTFSGIVGIPLTIALSAFPSGQLLGWAPLILTPTTHVVSSGFLIVESFRQLFFLEPAAYQLPSWTNYWPHLS